MVAKRGGSTRTKREDSTVRKRGGIMKGGSMKKDVNISTMTRSEMIMLIDRQNIIQ